MGPKCEKFWFTFFRWFRSLSVLTSDLSTSVFNHLCPKLHLSCKFGEILESGLWDVVFIKWAQGQQVTWPDLTRVVSRPDNRRKSTSWTSWYSAVRRTERTRRSLCTNSCRSQEVPSVPGRSGGSSPSSWASPRNCHRRYTRWQQLQAYYTLAATIDWKLTSHAFNNVRDLSFTRSNTINTSSSHRRRYGWNSGGRMASAVDGTVPSGVGYGEECFLPSRTIGGLGSVVRSPGGVLAEPRPITDFGVFWRPNAHFCTYMIKSEGTLASPYFKLCGTCSRVPPVIYTDASSIHHHLLIKHGSNFRQNRSIQRSEWQKG